MGYKKLSTKENIDLIPYIKDYLASHEGVEIQIGCDSQNHGRETMYAIVLALYTPGKGAHVLYDRFSTKRELNNPTRLMNEVWHSINLGEDLLKAGIPRAKYIDVDLNPDPKYKSNEVIRAAVGWAEGMGYTVRHKGDSPMMTYAADNLVK